MMSVAWSIEVRHPAESHLRQFPSFLPRRIYTDGRKWPSDHRSIPSAAVLHGRGVDEVTA